MRKTKFYIHEALMEEAYDLACIKASEEEDVDPEYNYSLIEVWTEEYYKELCKENNIAPNPDYISQE